ncbi:MAG: Chromosome partition protein smc, partial [uncultured Solirubrobacteraceae bacterium]
APQVDHPEGVQVLPGPDPARVRRGRRGHRRAERLGQVERDRRGALGLGGAVAARGPRPVDAGRHLRRRQGDPGALRGRSGDRHRQRRRRDRPAAGRDLDPAPPRPLRRGRVPPQRGTVPPRRRARGAERHGAGQGDALRRLPGPHRGDRHLQAEGPAPAHRGGRRARQAPQAQAARAAQARAHPGQPRPRARRRARGAFAAAAAQAPGRGRRAARAHRAPDDRGALGARPRQCPGAACRARPRRGRRNRRAHRARPGAGVARGGRRPPSVRGAGAGGALGRARGAGAPRLAGPFGRRSHRASPL